MTDRRVLTKVGTVDDGTAKSERFAWIVVSREQEKAFYRLDPNWRDAQPAPSLLARLWRRLLA